MLEEKPKYGKTARFVKTSKDHMTRVTVIISNPDGNSWSSELVPDAVKPQGTPQPLDSLPRITETTFGAVGHCIYCGAVDQKLTREHIIPLGLGGTFILPASSCAACAGITSAFERQVLRGPMWAVRAHLQLKSRRAALAPKLAPLIIVRDGNEARIELPLAAHPLLLMFPRFAEPTAFGGRHKKGIAMRGHATYCFGKNPENMLRDLGANDFRLSQEYAIVPFAQLLGKIAWAMAAAEGRLAQIDRTQGSLVDALIKTPDDIGQWVGMFPEAPAPQPGVLHTIAPMEIDGYLVYHIQLFADAQTPRYGVVVGELIVYESPRTCTPAV